MISNSDCDLDIAEVWNIDFKSMCLKDLKVRLTNQLFISIAPNKFKTVWGLVRKSYDYEITLTKH